MIDVLLLLLLLKIGVEPETYYRVFPCIFSIFIILSNIEFNSATKTDRRIEQNNNNKYVRLENGLAMFIGLMELRALPFKRPQQRQ